MPLLEFFAKYSLVLFIFLLPIEARWIFDQGMLGGDPWEYITGSLYATDILLFIAAIFTFWLGWKRNIHETTSQKIVFPLILIVGFGLIAVASMGDVADRKMGLFALQRLWEGILLWWVIQKNPLHLMTMAVLFVGSSVLEAVWGIEQFFFQIVPANSFLGEAFHSALNLGDSVIQTADGRFLRAYGTLPHPNVLGGMLSVAIFFVSRLLVAGIWTGIVYPSARRVVFGIVFTVITSVIVLGIVFPESISRFSNQEP